MFFLNVKITLFTNFEVLFQELINHSVSNKYPNSVSTVYKTLVLENFFVKKCITFVNLVSNFFFTRFIYNFNCTLCNNIYFMCFGMSYAE